MPRAQSTAPRHRRHRKLIKQAKGYYGTRKSNYRTAKDAIQKAWQYSYRDRRVNKRNFRRLWIIRINAAVRQHGLSYSQFIFAMKDNKNGQLYDLIVSGVERPLVEMVLEETAGNQTQAANVLGINRNTLRKKIKEYDLR